MSSISKSSLLSIKYEEKIFLEYGRLSKLIFFATERKTLLQEFSIRFPFGFEMFFINKLLIRHHFQYMVALNVVSLEVLCWFQCCLCISSGTGKRLRVHSACIATSCERGMELMWGRLEQTFPFWKYCTYRRGSQHLKDVSDGKLCYNWENYAQHLPVVWTPQIY